MTLLRHSHFFDSLRQVLLFLVLLDLHMHRCNSHRVSVENYVSLRQGLMRDGPSPSPNNTWPSKMPGTPSARYTILITATLVLLLACALGMHFMIKCALTCSLRRRDGSAGAERAAPKQAEESKIELALLPVAVYGKLPWRPAAAAPLVSSPPPPLPATPPPTTTASTPFPTDSQCAICLNEFRHGEKMRVLPLCGHGFHVCCIDAWLAAHTSCPMCRFDLNTLVGLRSQKISKSHISSYLTNPLFQW